MMLRILQAIFWGVVLVGVGCTSSPKEPYYAESTAQMSRLLEEIAVETFANPISNVHVNKARVARLKMVSPPPDPQKIISYKTQLAQELLHAGENLEAISTYEEIIRLLDENPGLYNASYRSAMLDYLAISYMRLGEQENCIDNHNVARCLLPIKPEGVHTEQRGSRGAIEIYEHLLQEDPNDRTAIWLMNVAYMTLGIYPDSVPAPWRIPPEALAADYDLPAFPDRAPGLGLDVMGLSGGVVMDDLNGDGWLDLMVSSWGLQDQIRYFENKGDGTFEERTEAAGLEGIVGGLNLVHGDYDNDGFLDIFVLRGAWLSQGHPNSLLRNNGDGTFEDVTEAAGLLTFRPTQTAAWGDFDNDGWLDLLVGNETSQRGRVHPTELFRNNGDGTFTDVARQAGLNTRSYVKAVVWGDYDNDGRLDAYVSNWEGNNLLFHNDGPNAEGVWTFSEVAEAAGVSEPFISFPAWFWDYDNDGWQDLFVSGWRAISGDLVAEYRGEASEAEFPRLYRNQGDGTFEDVTAVVRLDRVLFSMGANYGDLDNDGYQDFYVGTGDPDFRSLMPNRMFRNAAGAFFQEVTASGGFGHLQKGHGVAFGDLDNDGDQDVYAVIGGAYEGDVFTNILFENPGSTASWVTLRLEGRTANRPAVGARVRIDVETPSGSRSVHRVVSSGGSFGASSMQLEIGLGDAEAIEGIAVVWPPSCVSSNPLK